MEQRKKQSTICEFCVQVDENYRFVGIWNENPTQLPRRCPRPRLRQSKLEEKLVPVTVEREFADAARLASYPPSHRQHDDATEAE